MKKQYLIIGGLIVLLAIGFFAWDTNKNEGGVDAETSVEDVAAAGDPVDATVTLQSMA